MADVAGLYKRGEEAFQKKNYDYARDLFINILQLDPNHEKARRSLYLTCVKKIQDQGGKSRITTILLKGKIEVQIAGVGKNYSKRAEICQKYLCDEPNNGRVRTILAQSLMELGHMVGAGAEAELALSTDAKNVEAAKIFVASLTHQGKLDEAEKILERVTAHASEDRDIARLQRDLAAKRTMTKGFSDTASYRDVIKNKDQAASLEQSHHLIQTEEQLQAAIAKLRAELDANPTDARIPKKIGDICFDKKKDYAESREWYKKASQLAPQDSVLRDKVDDCTLRMYEVQIEQAQKSGDPKLMQLKTDQLKFKIQSFERRVQDRPTDMGLRYELGKSYFLGGKAFLDKAIAEFQHSVKDPKKKLESHLFLGRCFQKKGNFPMADGQYQKAEEAGTVSQQIQLDIWYNRACCNAEAGKLDLAIQMGNKILEVDINYRDVNQLLEKWQGNGK